MVTPTLSRKALDGRPSSALQTMLKSGTAGYSQGGEGSGFLVPSCGRRRLWNYNVAVMWTLGRRIGAGADHAWHGVRRRTRGVPPRQWWRRDRPMPGTGHVTGTPPACRLGQETARWWRFSPGSLKILRDQRASLRTLIPAETRYFPIWLSVTATVHHRFLSIKQNTPNLFPVLPPSVSQSSYRVDGRSWLPFLDTASADAP